MIKENASEQIRVTPSTKGRMEKIGNMGATYDRVLAEVLDYWDYGHELILKNE